MYMTDFAYDGPIFLVPLSLSYPSSPVLVEGLYQILVWNYFCYLCFFLAALHEKIFVVFMFSSCIYMFVTHILFYWSKSDSAEWTDLVSAFENCIFMSPPYKAKKKILFVSCNGSKKIG